MSSLRFSFHVQTLHISIAYLIEENEALQCLVAQSNKLINTLVKGVRDKPSAIKVDGMAMEEDWDDDDDVIIDEREIKLYFQGCEVFHYRNIHELSALY